MKLIKFIECEKINNKYFERTSCFINPNYVIYIEEDEEEKGYTFIGLVGQPTTIVKGTEKEVRKKLEGRKWLKIIHLQ